MVSLTNDILKRKLVNMNQVIMVFLLIIFQNSRSSNVLSIHPTNVESKNVESKNIEGKNFEFENAESKKYREKICRKIKKLERKISKHKNVLY